VEEHSRGLDGVREAVVHLEQRMDGRFEAVDRRFEGLERRLDALDQKLDQRTDALQRELGQRIAAVEQKLDQRSDGLQEQMSRQFVRLVGAHVATLVTLVAALVAMHRAPVPRRA
jgi:hypothetical protein